MQLQELDGLFWLALALALIYWALKALVAWLGAKGILSSDIVDSLVGFIP